MLFAVDEGDELVHPTGAINDLEPFRPPQDLVAGEPARLQPLIGLLRQEVRSLQVRQVRIPVLDTGRRRLGDEVAVPLVGPWEERDLMVGDPWEVLDVPAVQPERDSVRQDLGHIRDGNRELSTSQVAGANHDVGDVIVVRIDEEGLDPADSTIRGVHLEGAADGQLVLGDPLMGHEHLLLGVGEGPDISRRVRRRAAHGDGGGQLAVGNLDELVLDEPVQRAHPCDGGTESDLVLRRRHDEVDRDEPLGMRVPALPQHQVRDHPPQRIQDRSHGFARHAIVTPHLCHDRDLGPHGILLRVVLPSIGPRETPVIAATPHSAPRQARPFPRQRHVDPTGSSRESLSACGPTAALPT